MHGTRVYMIDPLGSDVASGDLSSLYATTTRIFLLERRGLQMSSGYDMMLGTWLGSIHQVICVYFSGLALLRHWPEESDCANGLKHLNPYPT
jgi:hypothetical protein